MYWWPCLETSTTVLYRRVPKPKRCVTDLDGAPADLKQNMQHISDPIREFTLSSADPNVYAGGFPGGLKLYYFNVSLIL